jgi:hypothetical protein
VLTRLIVLYREIRATLNTGDFGMFLYSIPVSARKLDIHETVHRDTAMKITNKMHYID